MPMGLTNASATFQRAMDHMLGDFIALFVVVYLDDNLIYSKTLEEHKQHIENVIRLMASHNFKLNLGKCEFVQTEVTFLGHKISYNSVKPRIEKCEALYAKPRPTNFNQVRSFIGLAQYYKKFIKSFSILAKPLYTMKEPFTWTEECENAYQTLREILISENVLALPDFNKNFKLETDASNTGIGAVLSQNYDGTEKPVAFFSAHLSKTQQNYSASGKE
jgi:hypothetical protein